MAVTISVTSRQAIGRERRSRGTITFDSSYPTGGEAVTAAGLGLGVLGELRVFPSGTGYVGAWDRSVSAPKVLAFYGDNNNASDGALIEVPDTTNLATVIFPFEAIGY